MRFCTITPDRGDRPQFLDFCRHQLERMEVKPDKSYFILDEPKNSRPDLTWRLKLGLHMAERDGFDICYIIESDDYYPKDYFEKMYLHDGEDFIGCSKTVYYNLRNQTWNEFSHEKRSSLFNTGFRISALKGFDWPANDHLFVDIMLWKHAMKHNHYLYDEAVGVGIKHNVGKVGGIGHKLTMPNQDDWQYLKDKVDPEAFMFYKSLHL